MRNRPAVLLIGPTAAVLAMAAATLAATAGPAAAIPGYRFEAVWPATAHGLAAPRSLTTGPDGRVWVLDGTAKAAVALTADGGFSERRTVPVDALDLAADGDGDLFIGRPNPFGGSVTRFDGRGAIRWSRNSPGGSGAGVTLTSGRVWLTEPKATALAWLGTADGGVTGRLAARGAADGFPSDVAAAPDGTLIASDLIGRAVYVWSPPYLPGDARRWEVLETSGPFRVAAGADADGEVLAAVLVAAGQVRVHRADGHLLARFHVPGEPADLAFGPTGRLYVLDDASGEIRVYVPGPSPTPTAVPADPPLVHGSCRLVGNRVLAPDTVDRCGTALVTLRLSAECPPDAVTGADVVVVMDHSTSMREGRPTRKIDAARDAATRFVANLDYRYHRAAVVAFNETARLAQPLTDDPVAVAAALDTYTLEFGTNYEAAIRAAMEHLTAAGRPGALPVIVMLTDGEPVLPLVPEPAVASLVAAERARSRRAYLITIGLGTTIDSRLMAAIASSPDDFYYSPDTVDLDRIYDRILKIIGRLGVTEVTVEDTPRAGFTRFVPGSGAPPPLVVGDRLTWYRPALPAAGMAFTYTLRADGQPGFGPAGAAQVRYVDADGTRRSWAFPEPDLTVRLPAATAAPAATGSAAPPASATPAPFVTPAPCAVADSWTVALKVYPDTVGAGGYDCPGCNGSWDAGDQWRGNVLAAPVTIAIADGSGQTLWRGQVVPAGVGPMRAVVRLCAPPPYVVTLEAVPAGYVACPNTPSGRRLGTTAFGGGRYTEVHFGLWSGCGPARPTPTPLPAATALPACP